MFYILDSKSSLPLALFTDSADAESFLEDHLNLGPSMSKKEIVLDKLKSVLGKKLFFCISESGVTQIYQIRPRIDSSNLNVLSKVGDRTEGYVWAVDGEEATRIVEEFIP